MAKWGVRGLTKTLAQELKGTGIVVNTVCPTKVKTPLRRKAPGQHTIFVKYVSKTCHTSYGSVAIHLCCPMANRRSVGNTEWNPKRKRP